MDFLRRERDEAVDQGDIASAKLKSCTLSTTLITNNDQKSKYYTGLEWNIFCNIFDVLLAAIPDKGIPKTPYID